MVSAIASGQAAAQVLEATTAKSAQAVTSAASATASLKPDTVSISSQGRQMASAGDVDHDGDSA